MRRNLKRLGWLLGGWLLLVLGVAGLFLPFLQGVLFLIVGLWMISHESVWAHRLLERLRARFPQHAERIERLRARFRRRPT